MKNQYEIDYQQGYDTANDEWLDRMDKIRDEIEKTYLNITYKENYKVGGTWGLRKALDIIDKYKEKNVKYENVYHKGYIDAMRDFRKEQSRNMDEIKEVINYDTDAETKCKMISDILNSEPHYFKEE